MRSLAALLLCVSLGCKDTEPEAPRAKQSGGSSITTKKDAGASQGVPDDDGGATLGAESPRDAGVYVLPDECHNVQVASQPGESPLTGRYVNAVDEPPEFKVTRTVGTYEPNCTAPTIRISLSDGACPAGRGHEVSFYLDAAAVDDGRIRVGQNIVEAETDLSPIRVRYLRPRGLKPSGEFGSCGTGTSGGVTFRDKHINTGTSAQFEALFQLVLPPCDGSEGGPQQIIGSFDVPMQRSLAQACPP